MKAVNRLARSSRLRVGGQRGLSWALRGAALGAALLAGAELAARRWPIEPMAPVVLACAAVAVLVAAAGAVRAWPALPEAARLADVRLGGRERVSTALEFATAEGVLPARLRADAGAFAAAAGLRPLTRGHWPVRAAAALVAAVALAALLAALPNPALDRWRAERAGAAAQARAADQVAAIAAQAAAARPGEDAARRRQLETELKRAEEAVRKAPDPASAVAALSRAQAAIASLPDPSLPQRQAGSAAAGQALARQPGPAQAAGDRLAAQDGAGAARALRRLAGSLDSLSDADRRQLAGQLDAAAQAAQQGGDAALATSLAQASSALRSGDAAGARAALDAAAQESERLAADSAFTGDANQAANALQAAKQPLAAAAQAGAATGGGPAPGGSQGSGQNPGQNPGQGGGRQPGGQGAGQPGAGSGQGGAGPSGHGPAPGTGEKIFVPGQNQSTGAGQNDEVTSRGRDAQLVPYADVYADYRAAALNQVSREAVPQEDQDLVIKYFQELGR